MAEQWTVSFGLDCFAITIEDGRVTDAPVFARAMIGKTKAEAKRYIYQNDGNYECLTPKSTPGESA